jgi:hypothetical protein
MSSDKIKIAVIDLDAPELNTPHKKHYAADVIKQLQAKGEAQWTHRRGGYRGRCEYLSKPAQIMTLWTSH